MLLVNGLRATADDGGDLSDEVLDHGARARAAVMIVFPVCCRSQFEDIEQLPDTTIEAGAPARAAILAVVVIVRSLHVSEELDQSIQ